VGDPGDIRSAATDLDDRLDHREGAPAKENQQDRYRGTNPDEPARKVDTSVRQTAVDIT
jgi:hypothetical protein